MSTDPGVVIAGFLTVLVWSYLYKQNIVFQVVEHLFVGLSAAHAMTVAYFGIVQNGVVPLVAGDHLFLIFPLIGGVLLYARFVPRLSWLSRIPLGFTMGTAAAVAIRGALDASLVKQVQGTMVPLTSVNNVVLVAGTVATVAHFLFNLRSRRGVGEWTSAFGRLIMMAAFGAAYGNTVMMRMSLLIPRVKSVFGDWLGLIK
jgi:hypothetical protein